MALKVLCDLASAYLFAANASNMLFIQGHLQFLEHAVYIYACMFLLMLFPLLKMSLFVSYLSFLLLSAPIMILFHSLGPNSNASSVRLHCLLCLNNYAICSSVVFCSCSRYCIIGNCMHI